MDLTLQSYMSYGLGSGSGGSTVSELGCYNDRAEGGPCTSAALLACSQVWAPSISKGVLR